MVRFRSPVPVDLVHRQVSGIVHGHGYAIGTTVIARAQRRRERPPRGMTRHNSGAHNDLLTWLFCGLQNAS